MSDSTGPSSYPAGQETAPEPASGSVSREQETPAAAVSETDPPSSEVLPALLPEAEVSDYDASLPVSGPATGGVGLPPDTPSGGGGEDGDDEEDEMVKMSFLEHLEELRRRIINSLIAVGAGFGVCFWFSQAIFDNLAQPVTSVLRKLKMPDKLYFTHPADAFNVFLQIGLVAGIFLASPYVIYQIWGFIAPGLYKRERKYAAPFVFVCSALFISGGAFGYFIAFPYALEFLLGMGGEHLTPWLSAKEYLELFTTIILGLGIIFEMPVLIMFLSFLRVVSPEFLMRNFRYAVLIITIIAAVVTPTTDIMNMMVFEIPMLALYLVGAGAAWLVTRHRRKGEA